MNQHGWAPFRAGTSGLCSPFFPCRHRHHGRHQPEWGARKSPTQHPQRHNERHRHLLIYLLLAFWLARVALQEEMLTNSTVMVDKAYFCWAVLAGLLGGTFSSALGSLLAAPRVMQALGNHGVLPYGRFFAQETAEGEPRHAMLATVVIVLLATIGNWGCGWPI